MNTPEPGFYRHYKHDPNGAPFNYMYEVVGIARDSEDRSFSVLYRPLYENDWFAPADFAARPLDMFFEEVTINGSTRPRFEKITDPTLVAQLEAVKKQLYT